ncbi:MAG TPA: response regulator [Rubrobacteraceae bacterium]|nr:response regulator [Rubrobacteraceae bacterium]
MSNDFILLADDNTRSADLFVKVLRMRDIGTGVVLARDGAETLDYLFGEGEHAGRDTSVMPRLVILDLNMPGMDGLEVLTRLRADERTALLPIIIFSASGTTRDMAQAYRMGANAYVDKVSSTTFPEAVWHMVYFWLNVNQPPPVLEHLPS